MYKSQVFKNKDFRGANLRSADFRYARLINCDFSGADLSGAWIRNAEIINCNFRGAVLEFTKLTDAVIQNSDFSNTQMQNASACIARIDSTSFRGADLSGAQFSAARVLNCDFTGANLTSVKASSAEFTQTKLFGTITEAKFVGAKLSDTSLCVEASDLTDAVFRACEVTGECSTFAGATFELCSVQAHRSNFKNAIFKACELNNCICSQFDGALIKHSTLSGCFDESDFVMATFVAVSLKGTSFVGSDFLLTNVGSLARVLSRQGGKNILHYVQPASFRFLEKNPFGLGVNVCGATAYKGLQFIRQGKFVGLFSWFCPPEVPLDFSLWAGPYIRAYCYTRGHLTDASCIEDNCQCGIYAAFDFETAADYAARFTFTEECTPVIVKVLPQPPIALHEGGWRAAGAVVTDIYVPSDISTPLWMSIIAWARHHRVKVHKGILRNLGEPLV